MIEVAQKMADSLFEKTDKLEKEAFEEMLKNDLVIHEAPADALAKWRAASAKGMDELIGKAFSEEIYKKLEAIVNEYRSKTNN